MQRKDWGICRNSEPILPLAVLRYCYYWLQNMETLVDLSPIDLKSANKRAIFAA